MFINKWLVIDSILKSTAADSSTGLCLYLKNEPADIAGILEFIQKGLINSRISVLIDGTDFESNADNDSYIEKLLTIFFQPCYYHTDYHPVLFVKNSSKALSQFINQLNGRSGRQGIRDILVLEAVESDSVINADNFSYRVSDTRTDLGHVIKAWLGKAMTGENAGEIHFLVDKTDNAGSLLQHIDTTQLAMEESQEYRVAKLLYQKQREIEEYRHQVLLKTTSEKYTQLYLSIQKEERANGLKWYYHEYEVLPTWYKRFGHIIKVMMGKRSLKSLFNDNVKKHKD